MARRDDETRVDRGLRPVGETLAPLLRPLLGRHALAEAEFLVNWTSIVGEELGRLATPLKLTFPQRQERREGTLHLKCASGAGLELQHRAPQVLERINAYFGYPAVARLALRQS